MMSSGKTKVGRRLARRSGFPLVDVDDEIVARAGMTIPEIFATHVSRLSGPWSRRKWHALPVTARSWW